MLWWLLAGLGVWCVSSLLLGLVLGRVLRDREMCSCGVAGCSGVSLDPVSTPTASAVVSASG